MTEREGVPAPSIPESRPEDLERAAIDARITTAHASILDSLIAIGIVEKCSKASAILEGRKGRKYQVPIRFGARNAERWLRISGLINSLSQWDSQTRNLSGVKVNFSNLPWPLHGNDSALYLSVDSGDIKREICLSWNEDKSGRSVGMVLDKKDGVFLNVRGRREGFSYNHGKVKKTLYKLIECPLSFFGSSYSSCESDILPGPGLIERKYQISEIDKESTTHPTLAEFTQTEEWQLVQKIEASFREAADAKRNQKPKRNIHIPRIRH